MDSNEYLLVTGENSQNYSAAVYDYTTTNLIKVYRNGGNVSEKSLQVISDDYVLTSEKNKPLLHLWPINSQEQLKNVRLILPEPATCLDICPKNVYIAVGVGSKLYVWSILGKLLSVQKKNFQPISCVKFSSDGEHLVVTGQDGLLITYVLSDLVAINNNYLSQSSIGQVEPLYTINQNTMPISDLCVGKFGKKSRIATVSLDQTCRIYNLCTGVLLLTLILNEPLTSVVLDSPCWQIFIGCQSGRIKVFNLKDPPRTISHHLDDDNSKDFVGHTKKVNCLGLNILNNILASGSDDHFLFIWEIKSRQILKKIEINSPVTNLLFKPAFQNFTVDHFKPKTVIKSLERNLDLTEEGFKVSFLQNEDISLSDDENDLIKEESRRSLEEQNRKLRTITKQLHIAATEMNKKLHK